MSDKILNIYRSILNYSGMHVEPNGSIYSQLTSSLKKIPVVIGDEPLVFPIKQQFDDPNQNKIYFHPLTESFIRGESEVVQKLREHISVRINFVTAVIAGELLELLGTPENHKFLNEEQSALLQYITDADKKAYEHWADLMPKIIKTSPDAGYVKIYLKPSGILKGESYSRVGVVKFPFYQDLIKDKYQDQIRVKDKNVFKKIMEFMFPNIAVSDAYNYGTRTRVAPYLDTLMMTTGGITNRLNDLINTYKDYINDADELFFNMDWSESFIDLDDLRNDIQSMPKLRGNEGSTLVSERVHPPQELTRMPQAPPPVAEPAVQKRVEQQHITQQPPAAQPSPPPPPSAVNKEGKLNFNEVLRANPALTMINNPLAQPVLPPEVQAYVQQYGVLPPGFQPGINRPVQQTPSWAAPQMPQQVPGYPPPPGFGYPPQPPGYPAPMQLPMYSQGGYPPPQQTVPPGYQQVWNPQSNQFVTVPIQHQHPASYNPGMPAPPPGWSYR